jgi:hypothetical protein
VLDNQEKRAMATPETVSRLPYRSQKDLWRHMMKQCAVPLLGKEEFGDRERQLQVLVKQVNQGSYSPMHLHGFLSAAKQNSVARFIPVFTYQDTAVYFACLQEIDPTGGRGGSGYVRRF